MKVKKYVVAILVSLHATAAALPHDVLATTIVEIARDVVRHYRLINTE